MSLINCPKCKNEIGLEVSFCPHCGYNIEAHIEETDFDTLVETNVVTPELERELRIEEYHSHKRKLLTRLITLFSVTLGFCVICDFDIGIMLGPFFGGILSLLFGKMMEDGIEGFFVRLCTLLGYIIKGFLSLLSGALFLLCGGLIFAAIVLIIILCLVGEVLNILTASEFIFAIIWFSPMIISIICSILDGIYLYKHKSNFKDIQQI